MTRWHGAHHDCSMVFTSQRCVTTAAVVFSGEPLGRLAGNNHRLRRCKQRPAFGQGKSKLIEIVVFAFDYGKGYRNGWKFSAFPPRVLR